MQYILRKNQKHISKAKLGNRFESFLGSHREVRHKKHANVLQNGRFDILYCRPRTTITRWNQYLMIILYTKLLYTQSSQKTGPGMASYSCTWETVIFFLVTFNPYTSSHAIASKEMRNEITKQEPICMHSGTAVNFPPYILVMKFFF